MSDQRKNWRRSVPIFIKTDTELVVAVKPKKIKYSRDEIRLDGKKFPITYRRLPDGKYYWQVESMGLRSYQDFLYISVCRYLKGMTKLPPKIPKAKVNKAKKDLVSRLGEHGVKIKTKDIGLYLLTT